MLQLEQLSQFATNIRCRYRSLSTTAAAFPSPTEANSNITRHDDLRMNERRSKVETDRKRHADRQMITKEGKGWRGKRSAQERRNQGGRDSPEGASGVGRKTVRDGEGRGMKK